MIVVNAANIKKDWDWIVASNDMGAELLDISDETGLLAVSGPKGTEVVKKLTDMPVEDLPYYGFHYGTFNGVERVLVATTGYTGERTYEIFFRTEHAESMWNALMEAGEEVGLQACGLGARDTLRLEMGYMLYGNDIDDTTSPLEAGLGWITKLKKGDFNGSDKIKALKAEGLKNRLVGFVMEGKGIPRPGYGIASKGEEVGRVTSGSISPLLGKGIGMGYVPVELAAEGSEIEILIRNKSVAAKVVKTPFITK